MATRRYGRWVIMLKQEIPTYSNTSKEASGHCTIEIRNGKGRMTTFVQGLKHLQKDNVYKVCIVSAQNNNTLHSTGVTCALMPVDPKGKGEMKWEFDPDDVGGTGKKIEDFNVIFVAVKSIASANKELTTPLVGYMDGKVSWKSNYKPFVKERASEKVADIVEIDTSITENVLPVEQNESEVPIIIETEQLAEISDSGNKPEEQSETISQSINTSDDIWYLKENYGVDLLLGASQNECLQSTQTENESETAVQVSESETAVQVSEAGDAENEQAVYTKPTTGRNDENKVTATENDSYSMFEETLPNPHKEYKEKILKHKSKISELINYKLIPKEDCMDNYVGIQKTHKSNNSDLEYMFEHNPVMYPFESQFKEYTWIRIALPDLAALPIDVWKYGNHPFLLSGYRKYNHFILGTYFESPASKFILGVPGTYYSNYRLKASKLGFKQFKCCNDNTPVEGSYGYWLMSISNY